MSPPELADLWPHFTGLQALGMTLVASRPSSAMSATALLRGPNFFIQLIRDRGDSIYLIGPTPGELHLLERALGFATQQELDEPVADSDLFELTARHWERLVAPYSDRAQIAALDRDAKDKTLRWLDSLRP